MNEHCRAGQVPAVLALVRPESITLPMAEVIHIAPVPAYQVFPIRSTSLMKRGLVICRDPVPLESFGS